MILLQLWIKNNAVDAQMEWQYILQSQVDKVGDNLNSILTALTPYLHSKHLPFKFYLDDVRRAARINQQRCTDYLIT